MSRYAGWESFDPVEHLAAKVPTPRRKYHNEPTEIDGVRFDSKKEADRYGVLKLEQRAGAITDLELQPKFPLHVVNPHGVKVEVGAFRADFAYTRDGRRIIEDVKSPATRGETAYRIRKRHAETEYGITIAEV